MQMMTGFGDYRPNPDNIFPVLFLVTGGIIFTTMCKHQAISLKLRIFFLHLVIVLFRHGHCWADVFEGNPLFGQKVAVQQSFLHAPRGKSKVNGRK
jgi:hypothetical protein